MVESRLKSLFRLNKVIILFFLMVTVFSACKNPHEGQIQAPDSGSSFKGENYKDVKTQFELAGFRNIELEPIEDLVIGFLKKDGDVESVSIDGKTDFIKGDWFTDDSKILIRYHTFPEKKENSTTEKNTDSSTATDATTEAVKDDKTTESNTTETTTEDETETQEDESDGEISIENNEDFKRLLETKYPDEQTLIEFSDKYAWCWLSFDATIMYMEEDDNTNILIWAGDYNPGDTDYSGPQFAIKDVNTGVYPEVNDFKIGDKVHVTVKLYPYQEKMYMYSVDYVDMDRR